MDAVFQYRIPELHPLVVHFPLSLLLLAAATGLVWMWVGTSFWRHVTLLASGLGTLLGIFAYSTGEAMLEQSEGVPIVDELAGLHEQTAVYALSAACAATLALAIRAWWTRRTGMDRDPLPHRVVIGMIVLAAAALVAWTGHIGATMVWGIAR